MLLLLCLQLYASGTNSRFATPHSGPVSAVACSPFTRDAVLSCGLDGRLALRSAAQTGTGKSIFSWEPARLGAALLDVDWSPLLPLLCATASADGVVYIFDLGRSVARAWAALDPSSSGGTATVGGPRGGGGNGNRAATGGERRRGDAPAAHGVKFNPRIEGMVAVAYGDGTIRVWRLGNGLSDEIDAGKLESLLGSGR